MTDLIKIHGIGKKMAGHLASIGYPDIQFLKGQNPKEIYTKHRLLSGRKISHANVCCIAIAWPCVTPITTANYHPINKTGGDWKNPL